MTLPSIRSAAPGDLQRAIATIIVAFSDDPLVRWIFPEPYQYLTYFPEIVGLHGRKGIERGTVHHTADFMGAAFWYPPEALPDSEALGDVIQRAVRERDQEGVLRVLEEMARYHPVEPHWYLRIIGVDPAQQGRGYGSGLLKYALMECDRGGQPAYLEATTERSLALYQRHGFEVVGKIQIEASPPMWPMLRKPHGSP